LVRSTAPHMSYAVQVNPSKLTLNLRVEHTDMQAPGTSGADSLHSMTLPRLLDFEFLFDGTGVVPQPSALGGIPIAGTIASALESGDPFDVMTEIAKFNAIVYDYDGKGHEPRKVELKWGTLIYSCSLVSATYELTLFRADGTPLRAVAKCQFRESVPDAQRLRRENNSSPDLTHLHEVVEGDTLPLLASRIYGDASRYLELARVNRLVGFRRLRAGTRIRLPPVEKGGGR
jgi:hypothetical protein